MAKIKLLLPLLLMAVIQTGYAQNGYEIDINRPKVKIIKGQLDLGGSNPRGDSLYANSYYLKFNEKPFYMISGEFQNSKYPNRYWNEEIQKMKAGGINTVATYVFWNMHEREEGKFDWSGNLNLRRFIQLCAQNNLWVIVRIGPFAHGGVRNGGLPDWLYGRPFDVRSNDPQYLFYVDRYFKQVNQQLKGLLFKDGGPVIGVQLENEYHHTSALWALNYPGSPNERTVALHAENITPDTVIMNRKRYQKYISYGNDHMKTLKKLAVKDGIDVPLYTVTGWGHSGIIKNGSLPVTAAYPYPTWSKVGPSVFYLYKKMHQHPDYSPVTYNATHYPSIPAEIGTGVMLTYGRRPVIPDESMAPLVVRYLGSGSNGVGYYTYHGGSAPYIDGKFYNAGGHPRITQDHQSPIGEYGQLRSSFNDLKLLHFFLNSYGTRLAPMTTYLPQRNDEISPDNVNTLRYSVRAVDKHSGFIFMHNFQDHVDLNDLNDLHITVKTKDGAIRIPQNGSFTLKKNNWAILPFNLSLDGIKVKYSTAEPLVLLDQPAPPKKRYVFFSIPGIPPEFAIHADSYAHIRTNNCEVTSKGGITYIQGKANKVFSFSVTAHNTTHEFLVVPKAMARNAWLVNTHKQKQLLFTKATILQKAKNVLKLVSRKNEDISLDVYGHPGNITMQGGRIREMNSSQKELASYKVSFKKIALSLRVHKMDNSHLVVDLDKNKTGILDSLDNIYLRINYKGDMGRGFINGRLVTDNFYQGKPWTIGLKRFYKELKSDYMYFYFTPLYPEAPFYTDFSKDIIPDFSDKNSYLDVESFDLIPEYKAYFSF